MRSNRTKEIIRKIAEDENLTIKQVEEITISFFRYVVEQIGKESRWTLNFKDVRIFKFALFRVTPSKRKRTEDMNQNLIKKREKLNRNQSRGPNYLPRSTDNQGVQKDLDKGPIKK